jgi:DNA repair protein RadC
MKIKDLPLHERPREKLITKGVENVKDYDLLAILLRTGREGKNVIEISKQILQDFPMKKLLQLTYDELTKVKGIDIGKACTLLAAFELTKRALDVNDTHLPLIHSIQQVVDQVSDIRLHKKEHFIALYLNARHQLVHKETISIGTVNLSVVHPRELFEPAIRCCAVEIVLVHNHPSGNPEPSDADSALTRKMMEVGQLMGIHIVDHVIVTKNSFFSFQEQLLNN